MSNKSNIFYIVVGAIIGVILVAGIVAIGVSQTSQTQSVSSALVPTQVLTEPVVVDYHYPWWWYEGDFPDYSVSARNFRPRHHFAEMHHRRH